MPSNQVSPTNFLHQIFCGRGRLISTGFRIWEETMATAQVNGIDVYYEIHGSGERVVLISGTGGDLRSDPGRATSLLAKNFEVLLYDQRGLGQSGKPDVPYTMAQYADDAAALMTAIGWDRAHVMGISFGGMVAQHLVLRYPERVNKLVLACTSSGGDGGSSFDLLSVHDLPTDERMAITMPIMDMRNDLTVDPPLLAPWFDVLFPIWKANKPLNGDDPSWAIGARRQLEARLGHNVYDQLNQIRARTFVVGGTFDAQAPVANVNALAKAISGSSVQFFDGGHLFLLQDPTAWPSVVAFLQG
jgi:3-oxoadipate enol-lactonase